ncbi:Hypothetical_protein [Hexamita inflata]|uniref:Hypothetical_protein n=1 Tax=Hexamita inflata TaxID=28002 RepID=A0AA86ND78_9EUKA|nr:Hypothetical protein HINF_LOCUS4730 [Hexamita inflata]CAI9964228.1 Hypothetical protein HINF_LOCUS51873 [Hexamita inflata]
MTTRIPPPLTKATYFNYGAHPTASTAVRTQKISNYIPNTVKASPQPLIMKSMPQSITKQSYQSRVFSSETQTANISSTFVKPPEPITNKCSDTFKIDKQMTMSIRFTNNTFTRQPDELRFDRGAIGTEERMQKSLTKTFKANQKRAHEENIQNRIRENDEKRDTVHKEKLQSIQTQRGRYEKALLEEEKERMF